MGPPFCSTAVIVGAGGEMSMRKFAIYKRPAGSLAFVALKPRALADWRPRDAVGGRRFAVDQREHAEPVKLAGRPHPAGAGDVVEPRGGVGDAGCRLRLALVQQPPAGVAGGDLEDGGLGFGASFG